MAAEDRRNARRAPPSTSCCLAPWRRARLKQRGNACSHGRVAPDRPAERLFYPVVVALTILAVAPFWLTHLLPMQDYPQMLVLARAYGDCHDPSSPFFGTYTTGFPLSPLLLPILLLRALGALAGLETAGRVMWTLYAVGLPAASIHLLDVLGRDRWAVLLVFPIALSSWVIGGFFAFATAAPLFVLGLALAVRWLEAPTWRRGAALSLLLCALHLWHSLAFAQLLLDFGVLWLLHRAGSTRARLLALWPTAPALVMFAVWMRVTIIGRASAPKPLLWLPFADNATHFLDFVEPAVPVATRAAMLVASLVLAGALVRSRAPAPAAPRPFGLQSPFALLAAIAVVSYMVLPTDGLGVQGINTRQPWIAALLLVFAFRLPSVPALRVALLAVVGVAGALVLGDLARRFVAFDRESAGASRLVDRLGPGETLLSPLRGGASASIPGKPLAALELYASIRHGVLPSSSFAGYDVNLIRYVGDKNPMPGLIVSWLGSPDLVRYDHVLLRGSNAGLAAHPELIRPEATDGEWTLYAVCGGKALPRCL